jgi:hypothetical protein
MAVSPVVADDIILVPQIGAYAGGHRFLANGQMNKTPDAAGRIEFPQLFLEKADSDHAPVELEKGYLRAGPGRGLFPFA